MSVPVHPAEPSAPSPFPISQVEFIAMMALIMAMQALAIDAMLPALGHIAADMGVSDPNRRQLVVGLFLLGTGLASLIPGSLADKYGRRRVLLVSITCYVVFGFACALATEFNTLLVLRVLQALGCSGLIVMPNAIVRDRYSGDTMARISSTISMVFMVVPILAPSLGQLVLLFAGWRWIFALLGILGTVMGLWVWLRLPETLRPEYRQEIRPMAIAGNMLIAAKTRTSIGYVIGSALVTGSLFGFINSAQQLLAEHFGAGETFPLLFAGCALTMAIANFTNSRIVEKFGTRRVSHTAVLLFIATSVVQVLLAHQPHQTLWQFVPLMAANMCLIGFIGANFGAIGLQPFAKIAGAAASLQAFTRMVLGGLIGIIIGQSYDGTARPLALALLICGSLSLALVLFSERGVLFRRLNPRSPSANG